MPTAKPFDLVASLDAYAYRLALFADEMTHLATCLQTLAIAARAVSRGERPPDQVDVLSAAERVAEAFPYIFFTDCGYESLIDALLSFEPRTRAGHTGRRS